MTARWLQVLLSPLVLLTVVSCGVPLQSQPVPIPADVIPAPLPSIEPSPSPSAVTSASASPTPTTSPLRLWFVREDGLVAAESTVPTGSAPSTVLEALAAGPSPEQAEDGLRTIAVDPLTWLPLVSVPLAVPSPSGVPVPTPIGEVAAAPVVVELSGAFSALPPTEQVLLLGQVVLSLTGAGAESVLFTDQAGTVLAVPLPDGRLLDLPARARDYAPLIVQP